MFYARFLAGVAVAVLGGALSAQPSLAQTFEQAVTPFPVRDTTGTAYDMPFLGGFDTPRPQLVDLDDDGDLDLFVQEQNGRLAYFEHVDSEDGPSFEWRTDHFRTLDVGAWARFADLDGDGDPDLLTEEPIGSVRYYRNEGTASSPDFASPVGPLVRADGERLSADRQNVPALTALDCDGPPDLFLGRQNGELRYLRHTGTRDGGTPVFEVVSDAYQGICVGDGAPCEGGGDKSTGTDGASARRHGANALAGGRLDGDGPPDLLWGDFFSESLYVIENNGSCEAPQLEVVSNAFPTDDPIQTSGYNAPFLGDVTGDGDRDLLVGALENTPVENLLFLERTAADAQPGYTLRTRRFLSTIDVGGISAPAVADLDGDGDRDLVVGNDREPGAPSARLHVFENVGSPSDPVYEHQPTPLLSDPERGTNFVPAFADVDDDGDLDLFVGTFFGTVRFYRNTGTPSDPQFERDREGDVQLERGNRAAPALADIDADGDLDLFVGSSSAEGVISFFRNEGTPQAPDFRRASTEYAGIQADRQRTHPAFADVEGDDRLDLYLGTEAGVFRYPNTGTPEQAEFTEAPDSLTFPFRSSAAPAVADLNGDGRSDLLVGGDGGGIKFFAGQDSPSGTESGSEATVEVEPNPFRHRTTLSFAVDTSLPVELSVYDVLGRRVTVLFDEASPTATDHTVPLEADGWASGMYFYVLRVGDQVRDRGQLVLVR